MLILIPQAAELHELLLGLWGCEGAACARYFNEMQ